VSPLALPVPVSPPLCVPVSPPRTRKNRELQEVIVTTAGWELQFRCFKNADGRASYFDTVEITVLWHDEALTVQAQTLDEPLIGTRILRGCRIQADWVRVGTFLV
jgi:hypothetical protein